MIKCNTKIDLNVQKELNKNLFVVSLICIIIGSLGLLTYVVIGTIFENLSTFFDLLLLFALPFGFGIVFLISIKKTEKNVQLKVLENQYEFNQDYVSVTTFTNGENIGTVKFYYKDFKKVKESQSYIFLYLSTSSAFPVKKSNLSNADLQNLKLLFNI